MDLDYANKRLMAALGGIADGKGLSEMVPVPTAFGQYTRIIDALNDAKCPLNEELHADELDVVDRAFKRLNLVRSSNRKNEVAYSILEALR